MNENTEHQKAMANLRGLLPLEDPAALRATCDAAVQQALAEVRKSPEFQEMEQANRIHREALVFDRDSARMLADERLGKLDRIDYLISDVRLSEWELRSSIREVLQGDQK